LTYLSFTGLSQHCLTGQGKVSDPVVAQERCGSAANIATDDVYDGMLIPKDSTVFLPTWAIHHSPEIYSDPETFNPDRYLHHYKLASDYAGSPDWANRDKFTLIAYITAL
jgi:hypothetical protein